MHNFFTAPSIQYFIVALTSVFFLVDPFAALPTFLVIAADANRDERRRLAIKASITCFVVLTSFALMGSLIFRFFGITLPAFQIAGGIILILMGLEMLQGRRSGTHETPGETEEGIAKEDAGIIPLGIPMLAGPGAISTVMVLMGPSPGWWRTVTIFIAITITSAASFLILSAADRVRRFLGETGIRILMRLMGLLLTAIAVQFIVNGLANLGVVQAVHQ
ncbi:MAG: antibiotic resistance protein MarC [Acidobacteria bacterium]|nr:MAG: antibiotic resistance protein MarC [Acidobacteriota bacterium]PYY17742.1 MAG: antibiotic resistance protein MarC [Acidobacteriota bacterium]